MWCFCEDERGGRVVFLRGRLRRFREGDSIDAAPRRDSARIAVRVSAFARFVVGVDEIIAGTRTAMRALSLLVASSIEAPSRPSHVSSCVFG